MTQDDQTAFPSDEADPFIATTSNAQHTEAEDLSSWQTSTQQIAPRWQLLTEQEKKDQDSIIQKLESKLNKLDKAEENPKYTSKTMPDTSHQFESLDEDSDSSYNSSDGEGEVEDHGPIEEENEGLPLLWKSRNMGLDHAPKKTENQYNHYTLWSWCFPRCC